MISKERIMEQNLNDLILKRIEEQKRWTEQQELLARMRQREQQSQARNDFQVRELMREQSQPNPFVPPHDHGL